MPALNHNEILQIQQCLHVQGFDPGVADGRLGEKTRQALQQWQAHYGYTQTGELATSDQRAMLIDCITPAPVEQTAQTEQIDELTQLPPSPKKAWSIAKTDINGRFKALYSDLAPQRARSLAETGFDGWLIGLYTGIGLAVAAIVLGNDDDEPEPDEPEPTPFVGSLEEDWKALKALYNATDGPNWTAKRGWESGVTATQVPTAEELDSWYGVAVTNNRVTGLDLHANNLSGTIPTQLGNLTELILLLLHANNLSGTIPTQLGNLTNLEFLTLEENQLEGAIPTELGNLTKLTDLYLTDNQLSGAIPTQLGNLTDMDILHLGNNQLMGAIPNELGNLTKLRGLYLDRNQLTGTIPTELGNLTKLEDMRLNINQLTGAIPTELGNLTKLRVLYLNKNRLTGAIPTELGKMANMVYLILDENKLENAIPATLGNLTNLEWLYLDSNQLSGPIPAALGSLTNLKRLYLDRNQLSGPIPTQLGDLTNLEHLLLDDNQLEEAIPTQLGNLTKLRALFLRANQLEGAIPTELGNLTNLIGLTLNENQLSGAIPTQLGNLTNLTRLGLDKNQLTGDVPTELGDLTKLTVLTLHDNKLTGEMPEALTNLASLFLFSSNNQSVSAQQTALCVPMTAAFDSWLSSILSNVDPSGIFSSGHNVDRCAAAPSLPGLPGLSADSISIVSTPRQEVYGMGETIDVVVRLKQAVAQAHLQRMQLLIDIGTARVAAIPVPAEMEQNSNTLLFRYHVAPGDLDDDGISIAADALRLNIAADVSRQGSLLLADLGDLEILNDPDHQVDAAEREIIKAALAAQGRAHLASAVDVIGNRFDAERANGIDGIAMAHSLITLAKDDQMRRAPWQSKLSHLLGDDFALALDGNSDQSDGAPGRGLTLWGALDTRNFGGDLGQSDFDGAMQTWYLGVDGTFGQQAHWLGGLAIGFSDSDIDYSFTADGQPNSGGRGKLSTTLTGFYPYLHGRISDRLEFWGLLGLGEGEAELDRQERGQTTGDLSLQLGALGLRQTVLDRGQMKLSVHTDIGYAQLDTEAPSGLLLGISTSVNRLRLGLEGEHSLGGWQPFWQMTTRRDSGDGLTGSGLELGGGLRFGEGRLKGSVEGRWLAAHSASSLEEYGLSATLQLKPGAGDQGLSVSLTPRWGNTSGLGGQDSWQDDALALTPLPGATQTLPWSMQSRLGYGLAIPHSPAVLTPFMELAPGRAQHPPATREWPCNSAAARALAIEMGVRRDQTSLQPPQTAAELQLQLQY